MFEEFVKMLSLIGSEQQTVWDIALQMDVPITKFREITSKMLDLQYIRYEAHCFKYFLTLHGENVLKCINGGRNDRGVTPYILVRP